MFEQKDLEAGKHMVVTRDETVYLVANQHTPAEEWFKEENSLFLMSVGGYCGFEYKDLKYQGSNGPQPSLDIVKVYLITSASGCFKHPQWQKLVWKEDASEKVKQEIVELEKGIDNRDYHNDRARVKIEELKGLL